MSYELAIIGAGPAGLTAGIYGARYGLKTVILERAMNGGLVSTTDRIENYPGFPDGIKGLEIGERMTQQALQFGAEIVPAEVREIVRGDKEFLIRTENGEYIGLAIVIASGSYPRLIGVPGEKELRGRGVSYCATCDGPLIRGREVAVVGCGNSGLQEGRFLLNFATRVTFVEFLPYLTAEKALQKHFENEPRVQFLLNHQVLSINGTDLVESLTLLDRSFNEKKTVSSAGVFIYVGLVPNSGFVQGLVDRDRDGFIITNENLQTSVAGIFAGGDIRAKKVRQVVTACGEGAAAALNAYYYLENLRG